MDFFHPWPRQALVSVAARFLEDVELGEPSTKESLAIHMAEEHLSVTKVCSQRRGRQPSVTCDVCHMNAEDEKRTKDQMNETLLHALAVS